MAVTVFSLSSGQSLQKKFQQGNDFDAVYGCRGYGAQGQHCLFVVVPNSFQGQALAPVSPVRPCPEQPGLFKALFCAKDFVLA